MTSVTNAGHNPVEAAGRIFPPRRTIDVELDEAQAAAVARHRRLQLADGDGLDDLTVPQLRERIAQAGLDVPADARKADLVAALRGAN